MSLREVVTRNDEAISLELSQSLILFSYFRGLFKLFNFLNQNFSVI